MIACNVVPVASKLHGDEVVSRLLTDLDPLLVAASAHRVNTVEEASVNESMAVLVLTGGTEQAILRAHARRSAALGGSCVEGEPLLLIAHPDHNSLPAALEAAARLRTDGERVQIVVLRAGSDAQALRDAAHDVNVWHELRHARIGVLGAPSDWLVASTPDRGRLLRFWGTTLVELDIRPALESLHTTTECPIAVPVHIGARPHPGAPPIGEVESASCFDPVLQRIVDTEHLDAITVRCFDLITDTGTSGCLALSALNDRGVIAGCEGDVASAVGLLWTRLLIGHTGWMANPAMIDRTNGVIELAHCTVPLSLTTSYELHTHFESGQGVGIAGQIPTGPVTVLRLGGDGLEQLWCVDGIALATTARRDRCRTQLDVRVDPSAAAELLDRPLGNHLIVVNGHHALRMRRWRSTMLRAM
jgi:L-fucose isomerase-like protein